MPYAENGNVRIHYEIEADGPGGARPVISTPAIVPKKPTPPAIGLRSGFGSFVVPVKEPPIPLQLVVTGARKGLSD